MAARRSPQPEERKRDAERTRGALLDAALAEFSAKGLAGARVSEIAARAGVDKQLISYYFGGKDGLYRALFARWLEEEREFGGRELALEDLVARYVRDGVEQYELHRLFVRHALDDGEDGGENEAIASEVDDLRRRQAAGEIAEEIDPAFLLLILQGAVSAGLTFPGDARRITGLDPASPEFAERYAEQLRRVVRRLGRP
jgi:TetR/AcrR family transcriptional regulator